MSKVSLVAIIAALIVAIVLFKGLSHQSPLGSFQPKFELMPKAAAVFRGNNLQFRTTLVGGQQPELVRWSVVGAGSIDQSGLYHAPQTLGTADIVASAGDGVTDSASVSTVAAPGRKQPLILSTCYEDGTIDVHDAASLASVGGLTVGGRAAGIIVDDASRVAVFAVDTQVVAVDLATMSWHASTSISSARFSEVGHLAYGYFVATDNLASPGQPGIRIFRVSRNGEPVFVSAHVAGDTPEGIAAADDGRTFYVTNINSNSVMRFALAPNGNAKLTGMAKTAARPFGVAVDPLRHELFVADNDTATLNGTRANPGLERFALPSMKRIGSIMSTGSKASLPLGLAVDATLARLFVTNEGEANVAVFALPSMRRIATLTTGLTPWLPAIDQDAHRLYVPNARADSISVYDTRTLRAIGAGLSTCAYPTGVAIANPQAARRS